MQELRKRRIESLPSSSTSKSTLSDPDDFDSACSDDDYTRPLLLSLLQSHYLTAHTELSSITQEIEMLKMGMEIESRMIGNGGSSGSTTDARQETREQEDSQSWKVEEDASFSSSGPLLDPSGRILRPFTILPSSSGSAASSSSNPLSTRLRLQSEVFRSGHRLPTMTIDEFLAGEEAAGNILQGGGPSSSDAVEAERAKGKAEGEEDNMWGYDKEESGLRKLRDGDDWRDTHRKGEGNM